MDKNTGRNGIINLKNKDLHNMYYVLRLKSDNSRVDNIESNSLDEAKSFYLGRKQMNEKTFDKMYYIESTK